MRKKTVILLLFSVGVALGIFLMATFCDQFLGKRFANSRTQVTFPNYSIRVVGGIITKAKPGRLCLRATGLGMKIYFQKRGRVWEDAVFMEIGNLPRGFRVSYQGDVPQVQSRSETSLAFVFLPSRRSFKTLIDISLSGPAVDSYVFWVGGDNRSNLVPLRAMLQSAESRRPLFIVIGGDLVRRGLYWEYKRFVSALDESPVPVFLVPGNHDLEFCGRRYFTRLLAPDHYYFTYGESIFVVLDTNGGDNGQLRWLDRLLSGDRYRHRFVFVHKPPFDPRPGYHHAMGDREFARRLLGLLVKRKVDILFCSHIHSFLETGYKGLRIIITGGLGARRKSPMRPFHYVRVRVSPGGVDVEMVPLDQGA